MKIKPSSFIDMINDAESIEAVDHIYTSVYHLFGFTYSPEVDNDREWIRLANARDDRIEKIKAYLGW